MKSEEAPEVADLVLGIGHATAGADGWASRSEHPAAAAW